MQGSTSSRRRRRLWTFAGAEFDEASWALRVDGHVVALEGKPLEVLHELLLRAGEVVTKDEILDAVWPGLNVVEGSLPTAISKLRKVLGGRQENIIETVPRVGYRLTCTVKIASVESPLAPRFTFAVGDAVPGRKQWRLAKPLGDTGAEDVWLASHDKTSERRVFKFADAPDRLRALKREAALSRVVFAGLGASAPLPALLEWNFDASPYFLEYAYGGRDLIGWADDAGGLSSIPLEQRLAVAADICRDVADVHGLGVLHKDLKPANILIADDGNGGVVIRLADFGSGRLLDDTVLDSFHITDPGSLDADLGKDEPRSGTLAYRAPELTGDAMPTVKSDIYALGLILYQLAVGDFMATLGPGWEHRVADPLLRDDIRHAAEVAPERRLDSAADLAHRLHHLDERRQAAASDAERAAFFAEQQRLEERRRMRRPWMRFAAASLVLGLIASSAFAVYAWTQRNRAVAAQQLADMGYSFIAEDVLASPDPARSAADETVIDAIKRASRNIDQRFAGSPQVAARLHLAVARAFHGRSDFDTARAEYVRAGQLFAQANETGSDDAAIGRLGRIHMEATSGQPERLEEAGRLLEQERQRLGNLGNSGRVGFALAQAEGAYGYMADIELAERAFRRAVAIGETDGSGVPPTQLLKAKSSLVLVLMRLGRAQDAEPIARAIVAESRRLRGADHPDTLVTRQHWVTSLSMSGRDEEALRASDPLLAAMRARFGDNHRFTLALHSTRFESFAALGRYDDAAREAERVWKGAAALAGPQSHQALGGQNDYAAALCQTAQRGRGLTVAQDALASVRQAFGADYPLTHVIRFYTAECMISNRRHAEAGALLDGLDRQKAADLTGRPEFDAGVDLALAEIALARGDRPTSMRAFTAADKALHATKDATTRSRLAVLRRALVI
ncbi:protein kinase domain-containing protein [Sphingopyxis sp. JAI128]|uniref:protein kinase domain-containing protein n=1 Tax=Sphingopyxis sp. JAI128 TaxID=2723066 RepID=UPI0016089817|nr:winged helix-turn-helix domain-containing protein [Sphingopyxis sp. JAI128]MBB6427166.1 non-specific serine/threonine protein kinase [Sphingopyxis sp. JAI128]